MLNITDKNTLAKKGITELQITEQLNAFKSGFPFLKIVAAAGTKNGILQLTSEQLADALDKWKVFLESNATIIKFVPASGAASRMFKDLFEYLESSDKGSKSKFVDIFFENINKFAFYQDLNSVCQNNQKFTIDELIALDKHKDIIANLLLDSGLNYGSLPKGLLRFHSYPHENRTPMQEHLVEGALYAKNASNEVNIHFTVSSEHKALFLKHLEESIYTYEKCFNVKFNISFSEQKQNTDTVAVDNCNEFFRENGQLVFRPGGHGALIENLNDLNGDIVFIKNIDNVVPDNLKDETTLYKKALAGILVNLQKQSFKFLNELENECIKIEKLKEISEFCEFQLNNQHPDINKLNTLELRNYLISKLNRPIRVCGMVKNEGEAGGGPFLTVNFDGTISPQILESSQININSSEDMAKMQNSTHFNPVDLVCSIKNYKGQKFNLLNHIDKQTGFISEKSKNGKALKALELPGLWNGAMSDWNTIFVEVPVSTFNPVKTVNDLLRPQHQQ